MLKTLHPAAGTLALAIIATFWLSTLGSEMFGSRAMIVAVKTAVPWGLLLLVPTLAAAGGSGAALARGHKGGLSGAKLRRMPFIAANGLLVLVPCALFLAHKAQAGQFDTLFRAVQLLELTAGAINITLLAANLRDGLKMRHRQRRT